MTQARERFYPVDAYLLDLCLLDPAMPAEAIADSLGSPIAISFIAQAQAIENLALHDPQRLAALREAITDGWADVAGGTYSEAEDPLLPLESILWQFRRGHDVYRVHLDDRNVETFARRRFGLFNQLPQIAKRFGFHYAVHLALDAGRFPVPPETKRLWESPDGSSLETLFRPPLGGRSGGAGVVCALANGRDDEERPRRRAPLGPLAAAGRPVVSRPAPGRQLFSGSGTLDDAQRLFPSDRPSLRGVSAGARSIPYPLPGAGRQPACRPTRSRAGATPPFEGTRW